MKVTTKLTGSKKEGYVLKLSNDIDGFKWDVALIEEEILSIRDAINKKLKL